MLVQSDSAVGPETVTSVRRENAVSSRTCPTPPKNKKTHQHRGLRMTCDNYLSSSKKQMKFHMPGISLPQTDSDKPVSAHFDIDTDVFQLLTRFLTARMDIVLGCFPKTCLTHHSFPTTCSKSPCTLCASKSLELLDPKPPSPTVPIHNMNMVYLLPTSTWLYWNIHPLHAEVITSSYSC